MIEFAFGICWRRFHTTALCVALAAECPFSDPRLFSQTLTNRLTLTTQQTLMWKGHKVPPAAKRKPKKRNNVVVSACSHLWDGFTTVATMKPFLSSGLRNKPLAWPSFKMRSLSQNSPRNFFLVFWEFLFVTPKQDSVLFRPNRVQYLDVGKRVYNGGCCAVPPRGISFNYLKLESQVPVRW